MFNYEIMMQYLFYISFKYKNESPKCLYPQNFRTTKFYKYYFFVVFVIVRTWKITPRPLRAEQKKNPITAGETAGHS